MKLLFENAIRPTDQSNIQNQDLLLKPVVTEDMGVADTDFTYQNNKISFQGKDLSTFIKESSKNNPAVFSAIARELEMFRQKKDKELRKKFVKKQLTNETEDEISHILALCEAHLARLAELMQNRYANLSTGCELEFDEHGQLLLNGVNVPVALARYRDTRNPNARLYLQGLAQRLYFVLGQTHKNRTYSRLQDTLTNLYQDIVTELSAV